MGVGVVGMGGMVVVRVVSWLVVCLMVQLR